MDFHQKGAVEYIEFPEKLKGRYQAYTQADLTKLRAAPATTHRSKRSPKA